MIIPILGFLLLFFLAYANGANDNFKGVATLFGSGTTHYRRALGWATLTTILGSLMALVLAKGLLVAFSGKGLVPDTVVSMKSFSLAVGLAAATTVMLATRLGFPISTTHSIIGALVGVGLVASTEGVNLHKLTSSFFMPLLLGPLLAIGGTLILYPTFRWIRGRFGVQEDTCICIGAETVGIVHPGIGSSQALTAITAIPTLSKGTSLECAQRYPAKVSGFQTEKVFNSLHYLSAGMVSFARGLNDTPKIAAILLAGSLLSPTFSILGVTLAIALGGIFGAKKVANTLAFRVTKMDHDQGLIANLVTGLLVIFASKFNLPVSTTHVSCGALFGIGTANRQAHFGTIRNILIAWITTLPVAAALGVFFFFITNRILV